MDTIFLYNQNNESFRTEVVRFFTINDNKYLIFTLNEKDENGYVQLYVSRIENEYGKPVMKNIIDNNEWTLFKSEIQKIVMNNRNGVKNETDLNFSYLNNMVVTEFKIFKLKEDVAKELGRDKNPKSDENSEPVTLEAASAQNNNLTIEEILKQVSDGAKNAKQLSENKESEPSLENDGKVNEEEIIDYKLKYETLLETVKTLENENINLINNLVEAKAKLETIKDIIG